MAPERSEAVQEVGVAGIAVFPERRLLAVRAIVIGLDRQLALVGERATPASEEIAAANLRVAGDHADERRVVAADADTSSLACGGQVSLNRPGLVLRPVPVGAGSG